MRSKRGQEHTSTTDGGALWAIQVPGCVIDQLMRRSIAFHGSAAVHMHARASNVRIEAAAVASACTFESLRR